MDSAKTLAEVEDLYRPYKQKRQHPRHDGAGNRAWSRSPRCCFAQERDCPRPEAAARDFVDPEKGVETVEDAAGRVRSDIIGRADL